MRGWVKRVSIGAVVSGSWFVVGSSWLLRAGDVPRSGPELEEEEDEEEEEDGMPDGGKGAEDGSEWQGNRTENQLLRTCICPAYMSHQWGWSASHRTVD